MPYCHCSANLRPDDINGNDRQWSRESLESKGVVSVSNTSRLIHMHVPIKNNLKFVLLYY